ncbi:zinc finger protein [Aphelenchoides avenae]|nr:zinc finger protein [Aphelenchus avenae]
MSLAKLPMLFECVKCGKRFNKNSAFQSHMDTHSDKVHECDQCEKKYKRLGDLREHKQTAHAEAGRFVCDECGKICPHKKASRHMETHTGQSCECDVCGTIHRNASALALHKLRAHSEAKHPCEHCGKVFRVASDLRKHVDTHGEKREEHPCARCPRTFKSLRNRDNHMRMEHSDSRFTCEPECDLHSATRSEYRGHLNRRHAKQHPASCKCVSVDVMVAQHVATKLGNTTLVTADGSMKCTDSDCDFATTCARRMESHKDERDHDVYQPVLRCIRCEIWFTSPSHLKSHNTATHEGERRFKCDRCGYFTNQKGVFVKHQRSCDQGKARGNLRLKRTEPTTEHLDVKKESPHGVYQFESKLGQGGFGKVYEAVKKGEDPSVKYAIKEVGPNGGKSAEIEAKCMRRFEHKVRWSELISECIK